MTLGVLGWKPHDWDTHTLEDVLKAYNGYRKDRQEQWEMTRTISWHSIVAMQGNKNCKTPKDLFMIPGEKPKKIVRKPGGRHILTREQLAAHWKAAGIPMTDTQIDVIMERSGKE